MIKKFSDFNKNSLLESEKIKKEGYLKVEILDDTINNGRHSLVKVRCLDKSNTELELLVPSYDLKNKVNESFKLPENSGMDSSWEVKDDNGETIRITIKDIMKRIDGVISVDTKKIKKLLIDADRDPERVENADLSYPIILGKYNGKFISIIDGNHRLAKALSNKVKTIKAQVLDLNKAPKTWQKVFVR